VKAVVLAGGKGTRLLPYTRVIPSLYHPLQPIDFEKMQTAFLKGARNDLESDISRS